MIEHRRPVGPDKKLPAHDFPITYCDDKILECLRGKSPAKRINADPAVPELKGAPFRMEGSPTFKDDTSNVTVKLIGLMETSFKSHVSNGK